MKASSNDILSFFVGIIIGIFIMILASYIQYIQT